MSENDSRPADENPKPTTEEVADTGSPEATDTSEAGNTTETPDSTTEQPSAETDQPEEVDANPVMRHKFKIAGAVAVVILVSAAATKCTGPDASRSFQPTLEATERVSERAMVEVAIKIETDDNGQVTSIRMDRQNDRNDEIPVYLENRREPIMARIEHFEWDYIAPGEIAVFVDLEHTDGDFGKHTIQVGDDIYTANADGQYRSYQLTGTMTPDRTVTFTYRDQPEEIRMDADRHPLGQ